MTLVAELLSTSVSPHDCEINPKVLVNEDVPHAGNIRPRDVDRKIVLNGDEMLSGFADHLEVAVKS